MKGIIEVFEVFQNRESYQQKLKESGNNRLIWNQLLIISVFSFLYGITMGVSHSFLQGVVAGLKLNVLFVSSVLICLPSFYIIQLILGSKIRIKEVMAIILSGFVMSTTVALAFSPIVIFFLVTGGDYYFMQLLHIAIFLFAGFFGVKFIIEALKYSCETENLYPKIGVSVFKIWAVIFVFVGIQLAWNLRPFLGDKGQEFALFRDYEGNFYTAVIYSFKQLAGDEEETATDDRFKSVKEMMDEKVEEVPEQEIEMLDSVTVEEQ